jgi:hypothetical protein
MEQMRAFNALVKRGGLETESRLHGLEERNRSNISKLAGFGLKNMKRLSLKGLMGTLEMFGKMSPKKRLMYGVGLAGLSVITGGALSAVPLFLSAGSFASNIYKKHLAKYEKPKEFREWVMPSLKQHIQENGQFPSDEEKAAWLQKQLGKYSVEIEKNRKFYSLSDEEKQQRKEKHAVRAALFGVALTAATSLGAKLLFPYVAEAAHVVGEKVGDIAIGIGDFFNSHNVSTPAPSHVPDAAPVPSPGIGSTPDVPPATSVAPTPAPDVAPPSHTPSPAPVETVTPTPPAPQPEVIDWGKAERIQKYIAAMGRRAAGPAFYIQGDAEIIALGDPRL